MNRLILLVFVMVLGLTSMGQVPNSFNYQAVVRNAQGNVIANSVVDFAIDLLQNGKLVYSEKHNGINTGANGIVNFKIGEGTSPSADFSAIDWSLGSYKLRMSLNGELMGVSDLVAVPMALYAVHSGDSHWTYNESDLSITYVAGMTEVQDLKIVGSSALSPEAGMIRYDATANDFIGYNGTQWKSFTQQGTTTTVATEYISNETELKTAIAAKNPSLVLDASFTISATITLDYPARLQSLGSPQTITSSGIDAIAVKSSLVTVENLVLKSNSGGRAITISSGLSSVKLADLGISGYSQAIYKTGTESDAALQKLTLSNIAVSGSTVSGSEAAVSLAGNLTGLNINTLTIGTSAGVGLKIASGCTGSVSNVIVTNSQSDAVVLSAINSAANPANLLSLANISINTATGAGLVITQSSVSVSNLNVTAATGSGVKITGTTSLVSPAMLSNVQISNTKVSGTYAYGISLYTNATASISNFCITGNSTTATDTQAIGLYANASQNFTLNGGVFLKVGKLISVENAN